MTIKYLELYRPNIRIEFLWDLNDAKKYLLDKGYRCTLIDDKRAVIHGESWINKYERVVLHIYFDEFDNRLDSIMIHSMPLNIKDKIVDSFNRKEIWLTEKFGSPQKLNKNFDYGVFDTKRISEFYEIDHFIKDRFGDEEGIYIKTINKKIETL